VTASAGASGSGLLPGGAGVQVAGNNVKPFISGPRIEEYATEVLDVTASGSTPTPAASGALLVMDLTTGTIGGATWRQSTQANQSIPGGQYGIVFTPGQASEETASGGTATGTKAVVITDGPCQALLTTNPVNTTAISAGMGLAADGKGNLTYAGASPAAGVVLARAAGSMAANISVPTLTNVYVGGY
jgi:hypothetical protein